MKNRIITYIEKMISAAVILFIGMTAVICLGLRAQDVKGEEPGADKATGSILENSGLPVVFIDTEESGAIITSKAYSAVNMRLENAAPAESGEVGGYPEEQLYNGTAYLKVRGNSTAGLSKKPYKVKLESKTDIFGMGSSKHWVLLANAIDLTGVRNRLLQELAMNLGLEGMKSQPVSLVLNGTYMGVYDLCEQVRLGKSRVDIFDWSELAEDVADAVVSDYIERGWLREGDYEVKYDSLKSQLESDYSWAVDGAHRIMPEYLGDEPINLAEYYDFTDVPKATGGALIEMDFYAGAGANLRTAYKLPLYISSPDWRESRFDELEAYLSDYIQSMEYALHSTDFVFRNSDVHFKNDKEGYYDMRGGRRTGTKYKGAEYTSGRFDGMHYTDFLDIGSAVNNFLVCEVSDNWDSMKNSFFMYKDIDSKIKFGPVWDFDWAWGNSMYGIDTAGNRNGSFAYAQKWQTVNEWFANEQYYQTQQFNRLLIRDPFFVAKVYERYHEVHDEYIAVIPERFDEETSAMESALTANYERWRGSDSCGGLAGQSFLTQRKYTRSFIDQRLEWLDEQFASLDTLMDSLGGYVCSDNVRIVSVTGADEICGGCAAANAVDAAAESVTVCAAVDDPRAVKLGFQVNGTFFYTVDVIDGQAVLEIPEEALKAENGKISVVQVRAIDESGAYIRNLNGSENGVYANAESCYAAFIKTERNAGTEASVTGTENVEADNTSDAESTESKHNAAVILILTGAVLLTIFTVIRRRRS